MIRLMRQATAASALVLPAFHEEVVADASFNAEVLFAPVPNCDALLLGFLVVEIGQGWIAPTVYKYIYKIFYFISLFISLSYFIN